MPSQLETIATPRDSSSRILRLIGRWWWLYAVLALVLTVWYTPFDWYQIDGDAVGYMDLSGYMLAHRWSLVVNGYWHPLYPAVLAVGQILFRPTRVQELGAFYWMGDAIFVLELLSMVAFTTSLCRLRSRLASRTESFLLGAPVLHLFGLALLLIAVQRELSPGKIRPDALLQALLLFGVASLANLLATDRLRYAFLMGLSLGLAYLTKSFALAFTFSCLGVFVLAAWFLVRLPMRRIVLSFGIMLLCFGAIAGPYIAALSWQHHRLDMGDSGALNYAWFVSGTEKLHLEPSMTNSFGAASVHLIHPEKQLLSDPRVYSFQGYPQGTYPPWFDPTYFNEHIVPHVSLWRALPRMGKNVELTLKYVFDHLEGWIVLGVLALCGVPVRRRWRERVFATPMLAIGLAVWAIYGLVNVEQRYVTVGFLIIIVAIFASLMTPSPEGEGNLHSDWTRSIAATLILGLALLEAGEFTRLLLEARRQQSQMEVPAGWYNPEIFGAAEALNGLDLPQGTAIGCIGRQVCLIDTYLARLANLHITSEIFVPGEAVQNFIGREGPVKMQTAEGAMRRDGAAIIVGFFDPGSLQPVPAGWRRLNSSSYYYFDLRRSGTPQALLPASETQEQRVAGR